MNFYETVFVIHPALQAGRLDDMASTINTKIQTLEGKHLYSENWGKKKLAYAIDKQKYGTYIHVQFKMNSDRVSNLVEEFEHNSNVLRFLVSKIEEGDILEEKVVIDNTDSKIENNSDETNKTDVKETKKNDDVDITKEEEITKD
tara:strand:- start:496 stop:930 length:435 start_codon:yes stop_codon:yes gene_type:complete